MIFFRRFIFMDTYDRWIEEILLNGKKESLDILEMFVKFIESNMCVCSMASY